MTLLLWDKYQITTDELQYIVKKKVKTNPNNPMTKAKYRWRLLGYFAQLQHVILSVSEEEIRDSDVRDLEELKSFLQTLQHRLCSDFSIDPSRVLERPREAS